MTATPWKRQTAADGAVFLTWEHYRVNRIPMPAGQDPQYEAWDVAASRCIGRFGSNALAREACERLHASEPA